MNRKITLLFGMLGFVLSAFAQPNIELVVYATGFDEPVDIASAGDDRLFIVERDGYIRIIDENGETLNTPFLDIDSKINSNQGERGLLGLVFHPDYSENGYFFVNYTNNSGDTHIARFSRDENNPNLADPNSEVVLMEIDQPFSNHNAGDLNFGPDGMLYFGLGDGGSGDDPQNNGQTRTTLLGKMIRIDVDNGNPYSIPEDNPFFGDDFTLDEIWAIGLRNPWRFSFDRQTGDMWIADVGQDDWEEVNFQPADSDGGENYGWRCYEGNHEFITGGCQDEDQYTFPVAEYQHQGQFCSGSITGGFVYRGNDFPVLEGIYLYADFCNGRIYGTQPDGNDGWESFLLLDGANNEYTTFGEDMNGELYMAGVGTGSIFRLITCDGFETPPIFEEDELLSTLDNYATYQWYLNGNPVDNATTFTFNPGESGEYYVEVSDEFGCTGQSDAVTIVINNTLKTAGIESLIISPNPFSESFQVNLTTMEASEIKLKVVNVNGQLIWEKEIETGLRILEEIPASDWPAGVYLLRVEKDGQEISRKLQKQ